MTPGLDRSNANLSVTSKLGCELTSPKPNFVLGLAFLVAGCGSVHTRRGAYIDFLRPDQRPPIVGEIAAADSLWGPVHASARGDGIAESRRTYLEELVRRFTPTLVLPKADHVRVDGQKYQLLPTDARLIADTLRVDLITAAPYAFQDSLDIPLRRVGSDSLVALTVNAVRYESDPRLLVAWYFNWPGGKPSEWWDSYGRVRTGADSALWAQPTVYAHPFVDPASRLVIQYWYLYPFNDFIGNHEGDWEHVNVVLTPDRSGVEQVHYYFHIRSVVLAQGNYQPELHSVLSVV